MHPESLKLRNCSLCMAFSKLFRNDPRIDFYMNVRGAHERGDFTLKAINYAVWKTKRYFNNSILLQGDI